MKVFNQRSNSSRAFTILEIVMVLLILSIIGVLVMRPAGYLSNIREISASKKMKADIRYAQSYALSTQKRTRITFDTTTESYGLYYESAPGVWTVMTSPLTRKDFLVNLSTAEFSGVNISQTSLNGNNNGLVFDAAGKPYSCNPSGTSILPLAAQGVIAFIGATTVTVEPVTGKVL